MAKRLVASTMRNTSRVMVFVAVPHERGSTALTPLGPIRTPNAVPRPTSLMYNYARGQGERLRPGEPRE